MKKLIIALLLCLVASLPLAADGLIANSPFSFEVAEQNLDAQPYLSFSETVVGSGNELWRVPIDLYFQNSLFETLYYPAEIDNLCGEINSLKFFSHIASNLTDMPVRAWLGTTTLPDLSGGWIPSTELTLVFDSTVNLPPGDNVVELQFIQPYMYLSGANLVLLVQRPMDDQSYLSSNQFWGQTTGGNRARKSRSDSAVYDPANPPANSTLSGEFPKTGFTWLPLEAGTLQGTVVGTDQWPLQNASIQVAGSSFTALTNYAGVFSLMLPVETYAVTASFTGYNPQTINNVVINTGETTTISFSLLTVANQDENIPASSTLLLSPSPNPFSSQTTLRFQLEKAGKVKMSIHDIRGRTVRVLLDGYAPSGVSTTAWDGKNKRGETVSGGVYLLKMETDGFRGTKKLILSK